MSASLVGSEMCIRDSVALPWAGCAPRKRCWPAWKWMCELWEPSGQASTPPPLWSAQRCGLST
eukprot:11279428-Alexandrium_andersonii.AAC.1